MRFTSTFSLHFSYVMLLGSLNQHSCDFFFLLPFLPLVLLTYLFLAFLSWVGGFSFSFALAMVLGRDHARYRFDDANDTCDAIHPVIIQTISDRGVASSPPRTV